MKTKINIYHNRINKTFHGNKTTEDNECYTCLCVISLDSIVTVDKTSYP